MSYESPITLFEKVMDDIVRQQEEAVFRVIEKLSIHVDKEELVKALAYDRDQYDKGYKDGYEARNSEIVRCKDCKYVSVEPCKDYEDIYVCDRSYFTRAMGGNLPNDFCSYAGRREE